MQKLDWDLSILQNPPAFHLCITKCHSTDIINKFINDLTLSINKTIQNPCNLEGTLSLYGSSSSIENNFFIETLINNFVSLLSKTKIYSSES